MVTMLVLGIVATATIGLAMRAFTDTNTVLDRRNVLRRRARRLDRLTKQLRQATSVDAGWSTAQQIRFTGYLDGSPRTFAWRVQGSSAPYRLQESRDGGTTYVTVVSSLADPNVFTYTVHGGVLDQVTIRLELATRTTTVELTSDVYLRNA
ncbi:MAG: hypothetical protein KatS3mg014_1264 [Actinomycetota bacterium]|nr:MAG: hypothetical protein KatS3mg014_1264 [Actinomycetota bacterium]